jgi:hypothetical protein
MQCLPGIAKCVLHVSPRNSKGVGDLTLIVPKHGSGKQPLIGSGFGCKVD